MKVLIIDDEPLARNELAFLLKQVERDLEIFEAQSIAEAMNHLLLEQPDIVFLDLHLTNENGLTLADKIRKMPSRPLVIFATAYDNYAVKAFELDVQDYLLKPFEFSRVKTVVEKAKKVLNSYLIIDEKVEQVDKAEEGPFAINAKDRVYLIVPADIISISIANGVTKVVTVKESYETHKPLNYLEEKLSKMRFLRVHRAYIINQYHISEIQPWFNQTLQVTMVNGDKIPVSRFYLENFKKSLGLI